MSSPAKRVPDAGAVKARDTVAGPYAQPLEEPLRSPHWPLRISVAGVLNTVILGASALPLVLGSPDGIVGLVIIVPVLSLALIARLFFSGITASLKPNPGRWRVGVAAFSAAVVTGLIGCATSAMLGVRVDPVLSAVSACLIAGALALGSGIRSVELGRWALGRRIFLIGSERQRRDLAREVARRGDLSLVGFAEAEGLSDQPGVQEGIARTIADARPTTLVLSSEASRDEQLVVVASELHAAGLRVRALNDFYEQQFAKVALSDLSRAWFLFDVAEIHRPRIYGKVKRVWEGALAAALLVVTAPLVPVIGLMIRVLDGRPVLFRQARVGQDGRVFTLVKFRTMEPVRADAPPGWATDQALRITPLGRKLRRMRLDEIPQLWGVVRGDLALVGPRPEQPAIVEQLSASVEFYGARHRVRPGLTGWAQVSHGYGGSLEGTLEKLQYDFFYIRKQSLRLDLLIVLATVRTILSARGH